MLEQDVIAKFDNIIDAPIDVGYFTSAFIDKKTVGRKNKHVKRTRKNKAKSN
jgi:hypothetical protein